MKEGSDAAVRQTMKKDYRKGKENVFKYSKEWNSHRRAVLLSIHIRPMHSLTFMLVLYVFKWELLFFPSLFPFVENGIFVAAERK